MNHENLMLSLESDLRVSMPYIVSEVPAIPYACSTPAQELASDNDYGNGASIFTRDGYTAPRWQGRSGCCASSTTSAVEAWRARAGGAKPTSTLYRERRKIGNSSAGSRIGTASIAGTIDARAPSCPPSASQLLALINESLSPSLSLDRSTFLRDLVCTLMNVLWRIMALNAMPTVVGIANGMSCSEGSSFFPQAKEYQQ